MSDKRRVAVWTDEETSARLARYKIIPEEPLGKVLRRILDEKEHSTVPLDPIPA